MFHAALPQVLLELRRQHRGKENLELMKFVSKYVSTVGGATEAQYDQTATFFVSGIKNLITSTNPLCTRTLQSLAKDFIHEYDIQHKMLFSIMECMAAKHGRRWKDLGSFHPQNTIVNQNTELKAALMAGKLTFTAAEWELFDIEFLEQTNCVEVGDRIFQVDRSKIDPKQQMAPVEVLHDIVLAAMDNYSTDANMMVMSLFLLRCLHQLPWQSSFQKDTYEVHAIRAFKLVVGAMLQFAGDLEIQKSAFKASVHLSRSLKPGAAYKLLFRGGNDVLVTAVATMRRFPECAEIQHNGAVLIVLDSHKVPNAEPLHPERIKYQNRIFTGLGKTLVQFCVEESNPTFTMLTCDVLKSFFKTRIAIMTEMKLYISFFVWVLIKWDGVSEEHFKVRDTAISALIRFFGAKDKPPFTDLERAQHRDSMRKFINNHDMNKAKSEIVNKEWLGQRILSYMCPYSSISKIRDNSDRFCQSILLLCELCQDSNESRKKFIYESNGINMCLAIARYFVGKGSEDDMDVAVHAIDLLTSLYTQINCGVEKAVSPVMWLTANASCFASSYLHDISLSRDSNTAEPSDTARLISSQSGCTLISVLQDIMRVVGAPQILLQSCMVTLAAVTMLPENAQCIDTNLIQSIYGQDTTNCSRRILEDNAKLILLHCRSKRDGTMELGHVDTVADK